MLKVSVRYVSREALNYIEETRNGLLFDERRADIKTSWNELLSKLLNFWVKVTIRLSAVAWGFIKSELFTPTMDI